MSYFDLRLKLLLFAANIPVWPFPKKSEEVHKARLSLIKERDRERWMVPPPAAISTDSFQTLKRHLWVFARSLLSAVIWTDWLPQLSPSPCEWLSKKKKTALSSVVVSAFLFSPLVHLLGLSAYARGGSCLRGCNLVLNTVQLNIQDFFITFVFYDP